MTSNSTGYGTQNAVTNRLYFDGNQAKYELFEIKFLGYLQLKNLDHVIEEDRPNASTEREQRSEASSEEGEERTTTTNATTTNEQDKWDKENAKVFAELIQCIDDRSLSLIMRDARKDGKKALQILRGHYLGKSMSRIIAQYSTLIGLKLGSDESVTDYLIKAENACSALKASEEKVSEGLLISLLLRGLTPEYSTFSEIVAQKENMTFTEFKAALRSFEERKQMGDNTGRDSDSVMKLATQPRVPLRGQSRDVRDEKGDMKCFICDKNGHKAFECPNKKKKRWCSNCRTNTHDTKYCRRKKKETSSQNHAVNEVRGTGGDEHSYVMNLKVTKSNCEHFCSKTFSDKVNMSLLVDSGATTHIVCDRDKFETFDQSYNCNKHTIELADGSRSTGAVKGIGKVKTTFHDRQNNPHDCILDNVLYVPSYKQDIFSVQAATEKGTKVNFSPGHSEIILPDGVTFPISKKGKLYFVNTVQNVNKVSNRSLKEWHQVMGHSNTEDTLKLESIVEGMKISDKEAFECEICVQGKMPKFRNRESDEKSNKPYEFVHTDLGGPVTPTAKDGLKYAQIFVDDYSGAYMIYFLKNKSDTVEATKRFLADSAPYGSIKRLRSDNGTEFTSKEFQDLMVKNKIKHEFSSPYSPHQNGTAERAWRTIFDMARCLLIESQVPKYLWTYAAMTAAHTRNRCFNKRLNKTPYEAVIGSKPDLNRMHIFGTVCYAHVENAKKLDSRCEKGIFVGYDKASPAYLVYFPEKGTVRRVRCVKFTDRFDSETKDKSPSGNNFVVEECVVPSDCTRSSVVPSDCTRSSESNVNQKTRCDNTVQTEMSQELSNSSDNSSASTGKDSVDCKGKMYNDPASTGGSNTNSERNDLPDDEIETTEGNCTLSEDICVEDVNEKCQNVENNLCSERRNPKRDRKLPKYLQDYVVDPDVDCVNFCCNTVYVPQTYAQAMSCSDKEKWERAMREEMEALNDNKTYDLCTLPSDKNLVGGRWVYSIKTDLNGGQRYKARYVAKGFSQIKGEDYHETFAPTAKMTSLRLVLQMAAQYGLKLHQMDVKTAYLNAPIDCEIYIQQPKGFEVTTGGGKNLACKLNKSLYGLKQSGRNWNTMLHRHLIENKFVQNPVEPCLYLRQEEGRFTLILIWVDDLIIGSNEDNHISEVKGMLASKFKMKDLGKLSYFLGMEFEQGEGYVKVNQRRYLEKLLERFEMTNCKPRRTPSELKLDFDDNEPVNSSKYREVIGSLIYAMTCTRPDLSYIVTRLSQYLEKPCKSHWVGAKQVLRYLKGTLDYGLVYRKCSEGLKLVGYSDADWASNSEDRRSVSGYCFGLSRGGGLISWKSRKQPTVSLSSCEAEYVALASAVQEMLFLKQLIKGVNLFKGNEPIVLFEDNQSAIALAKNPVKHQRVKHIDIKYHFIREVVKSGSVVLEYCPTENMVADVFTKPVSKVKLEMFRNAMFGKN